MGGKHSKDAEQRKETSSPDPAIPKNNDAKAPMEKVQTNKSSTAVATSPSAETRETAVHEKSQAQDKGQLNKVQTELHLQPDFNPAFPPPAAATDHQFSNVEGPDTSRRQDKDPNNNNNYNNNGVFPPGQHNFYQPAEHGWDHNVCHDYPRERRDTASNRRFDQYYYPNPRDQDEFCPVPPPAHGGDHQYQGSTNDHIIGRRYPQPQAGNGRQYPAADHISGIQNKEGRPPSSGDGDGDGDGLPRAPTNDEQRGPLVYDNIVICEDPSKVVIGKGNSAGRKFGGKISGNRIIK